MRIEKSFLYLGIVLMPFIGTVDVAKKIFFPLGSGLFLFLLLGSFFWIIRRPHIILPSRRILLFIALFAGLYFISGTINISFMFQSTWQGVRGVDRFLLSSGLWSVEFVLLLYIYNIYVLKKDVREQVPLFLLVSFVLSAFCGCLELASTFGNNAAGELLAGIDSLYRGDLLRQPFRVQSFASEPSQYSVYLVVVFPLLLFKLIKSRRFFVYSLLLALFFVLLFATYSRTGYFIVLIELVCFCFVFRNQIRWRRFCFFFLSFAVFVAMFTSVIGYTVLEGRQVLQIFDTLLSADEALSNMSNISRFGATLAAWGIFEDNIFFGVGYDQFAFYAANYYPSWSYISPEILDWSTNYSGRSVWPPAFNYYVRLLAEIGIFGALAWIGLLCSIWYDGWKVVGDSDECDYVKIYLVMFLGQAATLFNTSDIGITSIFIVAILLAEIKRIKQAN